MPDPIRPRTFAHVVYRTRRFQEMLRWYQRVFGAKVQYGNDALAFLTYDDEHHRFAIANLDVLKPGAAAPAAGRGEIGVDHVAYGFASLAELLGKYEELKALGIRPYWCIHHGVTVSLYYGDPDGNQMEFQVDCFASHDEANAFMEGPHFSANPIGVEYDPDAWLARLRAGESEQSLLPRRVHLPVSEVRGALAPAAAHLAS
ncbi:MAG: VOC family protein [Proteobacteria bacterium]|nr:VOC family protein [Pseudomonadota bacterium]